MSQQTIVSRRSFLSNATALFGGVALGGINLAVAAEGMAGEGKSKEDMALGAGGVEMLDGAHNDANVIEQIVRYYGGFQYDQDAAVKAIADAKTPEARAALPLHVQAYQRRSHGIQAAMQAEQDGAETPFVIAALLHDIGHVFSPPGPVGKKNYDDHHEIFAAIWLRNVFIPEVSESVFRHVPAKRYLVTTRKDYYDKLSDGSKRSLEAQGGKMSQIEIGEFEVAAFSRQGVQVRIWDDRAKVKGLKLAPIEQYVKGMEQCLLKLA